MAVFVGTRAECSLQLYLLGGQWQDRFVEGGSKQKYEVLYDEGAVDVVTTCRDGRIRLARNLLRVWDMPGGHGRCCVGWGQRDGLPVFVLADVTVDSLKWKCWHSQRRTWAWQRPGVEVAGFVLETRSPPADQAWVLPTSASTARQWRTVAWSSLPRYVNVGGCSEEDLPDAASPWDQRSEPAKPQPWVPWKLSSSLARDMLARELPGPLWKLASVPCQGGQWEDVSRSASPPLESADWALGHPDSIWRFTAADVSWTRVAPNLLELKRVSS